MLINSCSLNEHVTVIAVKKYSLYIILVTSHFPAHQILTLIATPGKRHVANLIIEDVNLRTFKKKVIYVVTIRDIISTITFLHRYIYVDIFL